MASEADRRLLLDAANRAATPELRAEAAERYEDIFGEHPPTMEGPVSEGMDRMGPPTRRGADPVPEAAAPPTPEIPDSFWGNMENMGERATAALTFNASRGITDLLAAASPTLARHMGPERRAVLDRTQHPASGFGGDLLGSAMGAMRGPAKLLDEAAQAGGRMLAPKLLDPAARGVAPLLARTGVNAVSGAAENALANQGGDLTSNLLGAGMGAGGNLAAEAAQGGRALLRVDPQINAYADARLRGEFEPGDMRGLTKQGESLDVRNPKLRPAAAANRAAEGFARRNTLLEDQSGELLAKLRAEYLQSPISRKGILEDIEERIRGNLDNIGRPENKQLHAALESLKKDFEPPTMEVPGGRVVQHVPDPTYQSIINRREGERAQGSKGSSDPTPEQTIADLRYDVLREGIQRNIPEQPRNAEAAHKVNMDARRGERDIVYGTEKNVNRGTADEPDTSVAKEQKAATLFKRVGDENVPGEKWSEYLDQLAEADPDYARLINDMRSVKARDATRPTLFPTNPGSGTAADIGKWAGFGKTGAQLARSAGARLIEPGLERAAPLARAGGARLTPLMLGDPLDAVREWMRERERRKAQP